MNFVIVYIYKEMHRKVEAIFFNNVFVLISTEREDMLWLVVTGKTMQDVGKRSRDVKSSWICI